jgi:NAD+ synthase
LAADCADGPALAIGSPWVRDGNLYNAYLILQGGKISAQVLKHHLPNATVFDEVRLFQSGPLGGPYAVGGVRIGSPICEDGWYEDVAETLAETGAEFLLIPNGSPYYRNKMEVRQNLMVARWRCRCRFLTRRSSTLIWSAPPTGGVRLREKRPACPTHGSRTLRL